ncbi:MAG: sialidase family protein, partial [Planctomycetota bacterium]
HADLEFLDRAAEAAQAAVRAALGRFRRATHVATGSARVEKVASTRRLLQPDGTIRVRFSSAREASLREAPEGRIDPELRTVAFAAESEFLACLHVYATHPQSYYGDGRATPDFPGIARERIERETGVPQLYFTGCAGNVAAGKYNDGAPERREELAGRIADAMRRSLASLRRAPASPISWRVRPLRLPLRKEPEAGEEARRRKLLDASAKPYERIEAALALSTLERYRAGTPFEIPCLAIGEVRILALPGEPFVEFQLEAARLRPDLFVAVLGYADCAPGYICTEAAYCEGGYEPTASFVDPASERYLLAAIRDLLAERALASARLLSSRRVWDAAPHNAFTDLIRHRGRWLCAFREGEAHVSPEASIRVIRSEDGERWEPAARISVPGVDLRDPKLSEAPDGRLVLLGGWRTWPREAKGLLRSWVSFSEDGSSWTEPRLVLSEGEWLWRILWHEGRALGVAYRMSAEASWVSRLYASPDGLAYEPLADFEEAPGLTEATLRAGEAGALHCLHRRDAGTRTALLGTSPAPYREWTWKDSGFHLGGPNAILHGGRWLAAGRWMVGNPKTVVALLSWELGTLEPLLELPSGGDTSYPGLASFGDELWASYYSSHEGKAAIYLARIAVD